VEGILLILFRISFVVFTRKDYGNWGGGGGQLDMPNLKT
jgi:hypothetical protein